jgi:hypothetical protein
MDRGKTTGGTSLTVHVVVSEIVVTSTSPATDLPEVLGDPGPQGRPRSG